MKKLMLAGVAGVALVAGAPAHAADLGPAYKAPPVVAPVPLFTWTGCYIGGHVGGGWGRKEFSDTATGHFVGDGDAPQSIRADTRGFLGGGQLGCDYQLAPGLTTWVAGIQGSGSGADLKGDVVDPFIAGKNLHAKTDWLADVTGRVGVAWDRFMLYGKGGIAWAGDKYNAADLSNICAGPPCLYSASETRTGFVAGGGVEWAFWSNWSAFLEYDFYGFGRRDLTFACTRVGVSCGTFLANVKQDINAVKFGINYRFNWGKAPAPVVAKY